MHKKTNKIAIIGSGISGLTAGYVLSQKYNIDIYEQNDIIGGNVVRKKFNIDNASYDIDIGVHSFNTQNSTNLRRMLKYFNIPTQKINSSISVSYEHPNFEYFINNLQTSLKASFFDFSLRKLIKEMENFAFELKNNASLVPFGNFLRQLNISVKLKTYLIDPLIKSSNMGYYDILDTPVARVLFLMKNSGLVQNDDSYQFCIKGGASVLVDKLSKNEKINIKTNSNISYIRRMRDSVLIECTNKTYEYYDNVIFACHPEEILYIVEDLEKDESNCFANFHQETSSSVFHTSTDYMPLDKSKWKIYNYKGNIKGGHHKNISAYTRWINKESNIKSKYPLFISTFLSNEPKFQILKHEFKHPTFSHTLNEYEKVSKLQGNNHSYYCGSYLKRGTFECALSSALDVCALLSVSPQWKK